MSQGPLKVRDPAHLRRDKPANFLKGLGFYQEGSILKISESEWTFKESTYTDILHINSITICKIIN